MSLWGAVLFDSPHNLNIEVNKLLDHSPMNVRSAKPHRNSGIALLEIVIALLITGVIMSASFSLYLTQHKQLINQEEIGDMQSSLRVASAELVSKIRIAGYNIPGGMPVIEGEDTNPDTIQITFASPEFDGVLTEHETQDPYEPLHSINHNLSGLRENEWVYISDPIQKTGEYIQVSSIDSAYSNIHHNGWPLSRQYPANSMILKILRFKYYVDISDTSRPNLMCQLNDNPPQIFAEDISDLQFRYLLSSLNIVDAPINGRLIKEVMISVTAKTDKLEQNDGNQVGRRTLMSRVKVRNLSVN